MKYFAEMLGTFFLVAQIFIYFEAIIIIQYCNHFKIDVIIQ